MARPKRIFPLGRYRLHIRGQIDPERRYLVQLEYTWNRKVLRKGTNIFVRLDDWDISLNNGRGGVKPSYGYDADRINTLLTARVNKIDSQLAEFQMKYPNRISEHIITSLLADKPITRDDNGKDFVQFVLERLESDYSRNRIGISRYENGKSCMNTFRTFLQTTDSGTYRPDSIYVGDISVELVDKYIKWRREVKHNSDATINHSLTPIMKACAYASELKMIDHAVNARIQDMRISTKLSLADEDSEFDSRHLTHEQMAVLLDYYRSCTEARKREFMEMFFFAFHACGLRVVDVMTLQWGHVNFERKELRKIMIKTNKRHVIPLTEPALQILRLWQDKSSGSRYVFNLAKENLDLDNAEELYKSRNNATKCINQTLIIIGEQVSLPFNLSMHVARHTFAVFALNKGLSMSVVSRLLGHGSTDVTEKVYARFMPETLSSEVTKLEEDISTLSIC